MKKTTLFILTVISFAACLPGSAKAQNATNSGFYQPFSADSLEGFDEHAAAKSAISEQFLGAELKVRMYQLKRKFINDKYNIWPKPTNDGIFSIQAMAKSSVVAACVNEDFEGSTAGPVTSSTQVSGWTIVAGSHTVSLSANSCNLTGCCSNTVYESAVFSPTTVGYIDPIIGSIYPIYSVFGSVAGPTIASASNTQIPGGMFGNNFIRINSSFNNYSIEKLSKTFAVTSSNALFKFAFINVINNGHNCCDAGSFILKLTNVTTSSVLSSVSYSVSGLSTACNNTSWVTYYNPQTFSVATVNSYFMYNPWQLNFIDLTPYIGQTVNIDVICSDCTAGAHYSYSYFDAQCGPAEVQVNERASSISCVPVATLSAPPNLLSYLWNGPSGFSTTARSFTTTTAGIYTLSLTQDGPLPTVTKTISLSITSPLNMMAQSSSPTICAGQHVTLTASGVNSYVWNTGAATNTISVTPNSTTSYTVTGTAANGCTTSAVVNQVVNACAGISTNSDADKIAVIFPNPNHGEFVLNVYEKFAKAELLVTNELGQLVHKQNVVQGENKIKLSDLSTGIYYYTLNDNKRPVAKGKFKVD